MPTLAPEAPQKPQLAQHDIPQQFPAIKPEDIVGPTPLTVEKPVELPNPSAGRHSFENAVEGAPTVEALIGQAPVSAEAVAAEQTAIVTPEAPARKPGLLELTLGRFGIKLTHDRTVEVGAAKGTDGEGIQMIQDASKHFPEDPAERLDAQNLQESAYERTKRQEQIRR